MIRVRINKKGVMWYHIKMVQIQKDLKKIIGGVQCLK